MNHKTWFANKRNYRSNFVDPDEVTPIGYDAQINTSQISTKVLRQQFSECRKAFPSDGSYMKMSSLIEVIIATHLSNYVESPFKERSGLFLVAPPGSLKSTILKTSMESFHDAIILSDINVQTMNPMRDEFAAGRYKTMAFTAFEKIYERDPRTAANVEGQIKALACEGFNEASFEDHRMQGIFEARACIIGAMTLNLYRHKFPEWIESGFSRRFLWSFFTFADPEVVVKAVHEWKRIEFENTVPVVPMERIKMSVTAEESTALLKMVKYQPARESPFVLLKKIFSVLKWRYPKEPRRAMAIVADFSNSLGKRPTELSIESPERRSNGTRNLSRSRLSG